MPESGPTELLSGKSEDLGVEYKAWMDTSEATARANLARHIAALANCGGGYLVFGIEDETRRPLGETTFDRSLFSQDTMAGIVRKYLDPRVAVRVELAEHAGVGYPVVVVPGHGARPIVAIADGPQDPRTGRRVGIRMGDIYIRTAGPESIAIRSPDDWGALLDRCMAHRADLLSKIIRQTIVKPGRASAESNALLRAATEATAADFAAQTGELAPLLASYQIEEARIRAAGTAFCTLGYAFIADDGETLELDNLRGLNDRVSVAMRQYAYNGWASFLPLIPPERAPQIRMAPLLGQDRIYLEGMRLPTTNLVPSTLDYWRIYEAGLAVSAHSYWEDAARQRHGGDANLSVTGVLWLLHSLLAHARLMGQETPGVQQVLIRMDWRGLAGRKLGFGPHVPYDASSPTIGDRFVKTIALPWSNLRDSYFECLRRVALSFLDAFPTAGFRSPSDYLTREFVEARLGEFNARGARLFDD